MQACSTLRSADPTRGSLVPDIEVRLAPVRPYCLGLRKTI